LIQPLEGPSIYKDFLEEYGEGMHHIACMGTDENYKDDLERFKKLGFDISMNGWIEDIQYFYLDTESKLKMIVEIGSGHASSLEPDWVYPQEVKKDLKPIKITQIAIVTKDIKESLKNYYSILGWGPWNAYELNDSRLDQTSVYGEKTKYSSVIAETSLGNVDFELIE